ncbi:MAG: flagellin, partial [Phycisphaerae bacterium]|nr:flagellin [Phycisphaerae bacterium]
MSTINTNVSSLISQHNLAQANADLQVRLQRLSTGLRINRGADDPAGLITSERMRSEIQSIGAAIENGERASNVIATAEAALAEVADLLTSIKGLTIASANTSALSREEIRANQLEVDSAIESISRIANTTSFGGLQLLNGSLDYITSGVATSAITDTRIFAANFGTATVLPVTVEVLNSAQQGALFLSTGAATIPSATTLEIAGDRGVEVFQFASGTALSAMAFSINRSSDSTGIVATVVAGDGPGLSALRFQTSGFGDEAFVSVQKIPGTGGDFVETYDQIGAGATKV